MKYFDVDKKRRGFTLIEVLITIIIIGILSTIGITTFQSSQAKGRDFKRKADLRGVTKALESYMNDYGLYPLGTDDGKIQWCGADQDAVCSWGDPFAKTEEETVYLAELPKDTKSSQAYFYEAITNETTGKNTGYRLYGRLENNKDPDIPSAGQYATNCSSDAIKRYCNYVILSDTATEPLGCGLDTTGCTLVSECCSGSCNTYYAYSALLGYTGGCAAVGFCGSPPLGYTETIGLSKGQSCSSNAQCCTRSCHSFYADNDHNGLGDTCDLVSVCSTGSTPPTGYASTCCKPNRSVCSLASECCSNVCCGGICQPTGTQLLTYYRDQDGDKYPLQSTTTTSYCGAPAGYIASRSDRKWDCYDANVNAYPNSVYCGTSQRGDGSFDYNCNGSPTKCGKMYYTFQEFVHGGSVHTCMTCGNQRCYFYAGVFGVGCGASGNTTAGCSCRLPCAGYCKVCPSVFGGYVVGGAGTQGCQ